MATTKKIQPKEKKRKIRYAVVGLGHIAQIAVLPAFAHTRKNSELAALVSDDQDKLKKVGRKYAVKNLRSYEQYDELLASKEIDAVYIALPNSLHREYTIKAARAGVHVLCEKPMAVTEKECEQMIGAAKEGGVKLMIAYRLHFEEANLKAIELAKSGKLGDIRIFNSTFTMQVREGNIRTKSDLGGGTLYDIGVYCINAARYLFRAEPIEVFAVTATKEGDERFREVEEMTSAVMRFPDDKIAAFTCSFGAASVSSYQIVGTKGTLRADPGYEYAGELKLSITSDGKKQKRAYAKRDQFAAEIGYFSDCVLTGREPEPSGAEGLADVRIINALYRSAKSGKPVKLGEYEKTARPSIAQEEQLPPVRKPDLVKVASPSED